VVELTEQPAAELLGVEVLTIKYIKIKYKNLFLLIVLYGYKTLSLIMAVTRLTQKFMEIRNIHRMLGKC
jgi:hypothetical protein